MNLFPSSDETITGIGVAFRAGRITCTDLVERCLSRIDDRERELHAWVHVDREGALRRAGELDQLAKQGRWLGPLHGIPIGIKDIIDVAGFATAAGSELLAKTRVEHDAPIVAQLRAAGAVILGKTVTTQYASFDPPVTQNPWNTSRTPGGSSSGSAAAVATGMCPAALGSQTGGSVIRPAAYCGVVGMKPTFSRAGVEGIFPLAPHLDHPGPLARTVRDAALLCDVFPAGTHSGTGWPGMSDVWHEERLAAQTRSQAAAKKRGFVPAFAESPYDAIDAQPLTPPRIGRLRGMFDKLAPQGALAALDAVLAQLSHNGAVLREAPLPPTFDDVIRCHRVVMAVEAAAFHHARLKAHPEDYLPCVRSLLEEGLAASGIEYYRCREHQERARREILGSFAEVDVLACLAAVGGATDKSTTGDPSFNSPWSYTGLPAICQSIGLDGDGMPLSLQLIGRPYAEAELFRTAAWCEEVIVCSHSRTD